MHTNKRLSKAFAHSKTILIKKDAKFIFFSDIHRGDDSVSDEFARNQSVLLHALDFYYENEYHYVEVGDGDELWEYKDFRYIRQAHGDIFTVLKKFFDAGRLYLIYGNHNIALKKRRFVQKNYFRYYDEYAQKCKNLFPGITPYESLVLRDRSTGKQLFVVHGHQGDFWNDQLWAFSRFWLRYFWRYLHVVGFRNPASPAKNHYKRHKIEKNYKKWISLNQIPLICGHTHRPRFPKQGDIPYFNTGCCIHTKGITGIELVDQKLYLVDWRMRAQSDGTLKMTRTVVRGPKSLESCFPT
ncbi:MAG: serine/threonine protein phosphatase [Lachnospiraceae bacterium]|jgi:UDP-2,3-diacylglucosamine pyrophosphatase LpxH|nr:serine/threonine protein phosphatase [Lachnospiraceae bacterium]